MCRGERLVSRPRIVRREAVVSLDTSRAPARLLRRGGPIGADVRSELVQRIAVVPSFTSPSPGMRSVRITFENIFDAFYPAHVPSYIEGEISGQANDRSVPLDFLNAPRSTSRLFRPLEHFLRSCFEVNTRTIPLKEATSASWTVSVRTVFSSAHNAKKTPAE